ncbi:MAG: ribosome-associated translation inhibitor RaiA [Planctomycetes bacterium]|nr:ribosome-associated translation inhibitor RaiA [Planctomycetota bacterium]
MEREAAGQSAAWPRECIMRIDVIGRNLEITKAIKDHAEGKADKLPKFYDGVQAVRFTISKIDHQHKGSFDVELVIDVEKHDDFVSHCKGEDVYGAIDEVVHKGSRQLAEFKEKLKIEKR